MNDYDNTNKGAVWTKRQDASENAPDYKVDFNFFGADYEIAFWRRRQSDNPNGPAWRFKVDRKDEQQQQQQPSRPQPPINDEDVPF